MNKSLKIVLPLLIIFIVNLTAYSQEKKDKIWFSGLSRSYFARDLISNPTNSDTLYPVNNSRGYNLVDLNTHVNPIENIEIFAQLRIRNEFGSFFGSGTNIDVRQLKASGTINNKVNFSIGDIFLKQNEYTLYNFNEELSFFQNDGLSPYRDIVLYENFYKNNRWRLQGLQTDFSFEFDRFIRTLEFDAFISRPKGSSQITSSIYSPDLILGGGSIVSHFSKNFSFESNFINFFEVPQSGNINISIKNPVYHGALVYRYSQKKLSFTHKLQSGFSERSWLHSELQNNEDSISHLIRGMFFEFENKIVSKDSSFSLLFGARYVDPNFRSAGAQTRRLNFVSDNLNTVYPYYSNDVLRRPISLFDIITDENIYNQDLSGTLMSFNPIYANANPYGVSTPNRVGLYLQGKLNNNEILLANLNAGYFNEVIGQGTSSKRNFLHLAADLNINLHRLLQFEKQLSISFNTLNEITNRAGDSIAQINLHTNQLNGFINAELVNKFHLQVGIKQLLAKGNEFLTQRGNYGEIENFSIVNFNQKDFMYSAGCSYKINKNVYANIQYNWWGSSFDDFSIQDYRYQRLLFIFSVKL